MIAKEINITHTGQILASFIIGLCLCLWTALNMKPDSHNRRQPTGSEQHPQHPGFVAHRRQGHRSGSAAQRRQRHGFDHDRGERRFFGRGAQPVRCRRHPTSDPRGGLHASSAGPALPNAVTIPMRQAISTEEGYFPARKKAGKFRLFYSERILNSTRRL